MEYASRKEEPKKFGQVSLFESCEQEEFPELQLERVAEWPELELLAYEKENLGFYFSGHPMDKYRTLWEKCTTLDLSRLERVSAERTYQLVGMVRSIREIPTKKGPRMAFVMFEDYNGQIELVVFPSVLERYRDFLKSGAVIGVIGRIDTTREEAKVLAEEIRNPEQLDLKGAEEVHLRLDAEALSEEDLHQLLEYMFEHHGTSPVYLHLRRNGSETVIRASAQITLSARSEVMEGLAEQPRVEEVWKS